MTQFLINIHTVINVLSLLMLNRYDLFLHNKNNQNFLIWLSFYL